MTRQTSLGALAEAGYREWLSCCFLGGKAKLIRWKAGGYLLWGHAQVAAGKDFKFLLCSSPSFCNLGKHPPSTSTLDCQVSVDNYYSYTTSELLYEHPSKAFKLTFLFKKKKKTHNFSDDSARCFLHRHSGSTPAPSWERALCNLLNMMCALFSGLPRNLPETWTPR